jgi:hypothetical protein
VLRLEPLGELVDDRQDLVAVALPLSAVPVQGKIRK